MDSRGSEGVLRGFNELFVVLRVLKGSSGILWGPTELIRILGVPSGPS